MRTQHKVIKDPNQSDEDSQNNVKSVLRADVTVHFTHQFADDMQYSSQLQHLKHPSKPAKMMKQSVDRDH